MCFIFIILMSELYKIIDFRHIFEDRDQEKKKQSFTFYLIHFCSILIFYKCVLFLQ